MHLLLNCFPIEIAPSEFALPSLTVDSWEQSTAEIQNRLQDFRTVRAPTEDGSIGIFLTNGPAVPEGLGETLVGRGRFHNVVSDVVQVSLMSYFSARGLLVRSDAFTTTVTPPTAQYAAGEVEIRAGISMRIMSPSGKSKTTRILVARWEVKRDFRSNLDNPDLRRIALGKSVIYDPTEVPTTDEPVPRHLIGRYLGHIARVPTDDSVEVSCRDHANRLLPARDLRLEATAATIGEYQLTLKNIGARSIWHKTQELGYVLTSAGRRNTSVLRDRLEAIKKFISPDSSPAIVLPSSSYADLKLSLGLEPLVAEVTPGV